MGGAPGAGAGATARIAAARQRTLNRMGLGNADAALIAALAQSGTPAAITDVTMVSLRDSVSRGARLPIARVSAGPSRLQRIIGPGRYRRSDAESAFPHSALPSVRRAAAVIGLAADPDCCGAPAPSEAERSAHPETRLPLVAVDELLLAGSAGQRT